MASAHSHTVITIDDDDDDDDEEMQSYQPSELSPSSASSFSSPMSESVSSSSSSSTPTPVPPPPVQSRSGRAVKPANLYNIPPPQANEKKRKAASQNNNTASRKSSSSRKKSNVTEAYQGQGWTVRDHSWYPGQVCIEYASPPIRHLRSKYAEITCEDACQQAGLTMTREMRVDLRSETKRRLQACLSSDHEKGETDKTVLALCERGEVRGCALFQSDRSDVDSIKVVTTRFIKDREIITIYMGRLVEADKFHADYGDRSLYNVSSYDIRKEDLPPDYSGPPLLLDTNVCANEAKFIVSQVHTRWSSHRPPQHPLLTYVVFVFSSSFMRRA